VAKHVGIEAGALPSGLPRRRLHSVRAAFRHFAILCLIGFVPLLMLTIFMGQLVVLLTPAHHNEALLAGFILSLYLTPLLLRPVARFMRRNMTYWRADSIDAPRSLHFRYVTLLAGLGVIPWLAVRFVVEFILRTLTMLSDETIFGVSALFASYYTFLMLRAVGREVKRLLYPELLTPGLARVVLLGAQIQDGCAPVDGVLVDMTELLQRRIEIAGGKRLGKLERVDPDAGHEGDLVAEVMAGDADLALVAEPRAQ
jgi:hypothetical protein